MENVQRSSVTPSRPVRNVAREQAVSTPLSSLPFVTSQGGKSLTDLGFRFTPVPKDASPHAEIAIWLYDNDRIDEFREGL